MNDKRLNERQAAQYLGISLATIKRKRYNEEIGFYRMGSNIRYSVENHLNPYLEMCEFKLVDVDELGLAP
jgi:excisionase family DNA binding protein